MKPLLIACCFTLFTMTLAGCSAKVGSPEWCEEMKEKPKGEWTANEASEFAKSCLFK